MLDNSARYSSIALAKDIESPENPGGLEKRVALIPSDVGQLTQAVLKFMLRLVLAAVLVLVMQNI